MSWRHVGDRLRERRRRSASCEEAEEEEDGELNEWEVAREGKKREDWSLAVSCEVLISDTEGGVNGVNRVPQRG